MSRLNIQRANDQNLNYVRYPQEGNGWTLKGRWKSDNLLNAQGNVISSGKAVFNATVPTSSQPQTNLSVNTSDTCQPGGVPQPCYVRAFRGLSSSRYSGGIYHGNKGNRGPLNPIKQWRKQLQPSQGHITGKAALNNVMWTPGGAASFAGQAVDSSCCSNIKTYLANSYVDPACCSDASTNIIRNALSNYQPVAIVNPTRRPRPRSSQTLLKKNYYTTGSAYLKARVKLYEQNQLLSSVKTNNGGSNFPMPGMPPAGNNYVYPNDETTGTQAFNSTYCCATDISGSDTCCGVYVGSDGNCGTAPGCRLIPVTFKPSNPFFSVQGAVDSSTRVLQKRYAAITKNNFDFRLPTSLQVNSIAGNNSSPMITLPGSTPSTYRGETSAPYFIKSKYQAISACQIPLYNQSIRFRERISGRMPSGGTGIKTVCFKGTGGTGPAV